MPADGVLITALASSRDALSLVSRAAGEDNSKRMNRYKGSIWRIRQCRIKDDCYTGRMCSKEGKEKQRKKEGREGKMNEVGGGWDSERGVESDSIPARLGSARPHYTQS